RPAPATPPAAPRAAPAAEPPPAPALPAASAPADKPPAAAIITPATPATPPTAAEPAAPPDPLASLDPADRAVAEKIRDLLATKAERFFAGKKERAAAIAFYQNRNLAPLWLDKGVASARASAVVA